ncbi:oxidoreductase [Amycolatopsis antarctica]|uniref:Oxidoreductase n=1 Tax=Amycolatopsis antarctica TaxID=1854586 RepID=A0A263D2Q3_9PSEU|nr:2-oxoglutarate and iron-dependent oxygenase domain-containing protein [Amycolatopsis antarctica]OZM71635.1 oxidoreductase [Amycolatopsis antarctica]
MSTRSLPVLDLGRFRAGGAERAAFVRELRAAAGGVGFFYLRGHGVPERVTRRIADLAAEFFRLPLEQRLAIENVHSPHFRGYTRDGNEFTGGVRDRREQLDIGPERPAVVPRPGDPSWWGLRGPNQWPDALPELRAAALDWQHEVVRAGRELLGALAVMLGREETYFGTWFDEEAATHMKILHYPAAKDGAGSRGAGSQGVGEHKDYGYLTLLQQHEVGGLQVRGPDGEWIDVPPRAGSFVVNIGEMLELAAGGRIVATSHGVVRPDADRLSVALFMAPRLDAIVEPLDGQGGPGSTRYGEHALAGWLRSHPEVARRWWSGAPG